MIHDTQHHLRLPCTKRVAPDAGTEGEPLFLARVEEMPASRTATRRTRALENLRGAMELFIGSMLEDGVEPPRPRTAPAQSTAA